jgi:hypothetical protein
MTGMFSAPTLGRTLGRTLGQIQDQIQMTRMRLSAKAVQNRSFGPPPR